MHTLETISQRLEETLQEVQELKTLILSAMGSSKRTGKAKKADSVRQYKDRLKSNQFTKSTTK